MQGISDSALPSTAPSRGFRRLWGDFASRRRLSEPRSTLFRPGPFVIILIAAAAMELACRLVSLMRPDLRVYSEVGSLLAVCVWVAGIGFLVARGTTYRVTRMAAIGSVAMFAVFQLQNLLDKLPVPWLNSIFASAPRAFSALEDTTEVLGVLLMALAFYLSMRETQQSRDRLARERSELAQDVAERKRMEEALLESDERLRLILNGIQEGIAFYSREMTPIFVNGAIAEMLGYSPEELEGLNPRHHVHPDDWPMVEDNQRRRIEGEPAPRTYGFRLLHRTGRVIHVEASFDIIRRDGEAIGIQGVYRDVTQDLQTREALRESEEHYRELFEGISDVVYVVDSEMRLLAVNERVQAELGYSRDDLLGMPYAVLCEEGALDKAIRHIRAAFERGEARWEGRRRRKDGTTYPVDVSARRIRFGGRPAAMLISRDITGQKRVEEALRMSEERLRTLFEGIDDTLCVHDEAGNILDCNAAACRRLGFARDELLAARMQDIEATGLAATFPDRMARQGRSERITYEGEQLTRDGRAIPVEIRSSRIAYRGKPAYLVVARDITERKRADAERKQLEKQVQHTQKLESLGVLAGGIAHDFNNLLMGVLGNASLALMEVDPETPVAESLRQIETAAQRAADLSGQMLAYSGKGKFVVEPVNVSAVVQDMAHLLDASVSKKVALDYRLTSNPPPVEGDLSQLRQVLLNLVSNASDAFGDRSGVITVATGTVEATRDFLKDAYIPDGLPEGTYVFVEVQDTGCGMDAETLGKVFDPFFTTKFTGRGLGLAAVMGIVRGHKGTIKVRSQVGHGSTFTVLFPQMKPFVPRAVPPLEVQGHWHASGTVLLVDDEETVRMVTQRVLERAGFSVIAARDGLEGVEAFRERCHDLVLVLLDMTMPRMSGEEAFREMQRIRPEVPIILSSGFNEPDALDHFASEGLAGFIQKPYRAQELLAKIHAVLEGAACHRR